MLDHELRRGFSRHSPRQSLALCGLVSLIKPKTIFEIGTDRGGSTYNFALNAAENCRIFTMDWVKHEIHPLLETLIAKDQVVRLFGNSQNFDFNPFHQRIDFVFVNGGTVIRS